LVARLPLLHRNEIIRHVLAQQMNTANTVDFPGHFGQVLAVKFTKDVHQYQDTLGLPLPLPPLFLRPSFVVVVVVVVVVVSITQERNHSSPRR